MKFLEFELHASVARYISLAYKDVLFLSDTIASVRLTGQQAGRNSKIQKKGFKCPDILILETRGEFHGLFLELRPPVTTLLPTGWSARLALLHRRC